jgi:hypothetical protein
MSQKELIRAALQSGAAITPMDALKQYGCFRLAPRIDELRREGLDIETIPQTYNGKRYAAYVLRGQASLPFDVRA